MSRWAYAALTSAQPSNHQLIAVDVIGPGVSRTYSVSALATTAASFKVHSWPLDKRIIKLLVF
jgi:hypothetical protein